jgi:hypothetical protein
MEKDNEYCTCNHFSAGVYSVNDESGYWDHCSNCDKKLEDGFHYYDEPELY